MFPALVALTLLAACSNTDTDIGNQEENQTTLSSSSIVRNSSSDKPYSSSKAVQSSFGFYACNETMKFTF